VCNGSFLVPLIFFCLRANKIGAMIRDPDPKIESGEIPVASRVCDGGDKTEGTERHHQRLRVQSCEV
jgi:hypothetical protein